jgi:hypothetical protein
MLTQSEACEQPLSFAIPGCGEDSESACLQFCHVAPISAPDVGVPALLPPQETAGDGTATETEPPGA